MVTPLAASYGGAVNQDFVIPDDSKYNPKNPKLIVSVHMYTPYNFAMNADMSYVTFEEAYANELYSDFKNLYETFILRGYNVIIGEKAAPKKKSRKLLYFILIIAIIAIAYCIINQCNNSENVSYSKINKYSYYDF